MRDREKIEIEIEKEQERRSLRVSREKHWPDSSDHLRYMKHDTRSRSRDHAKFLNILRISKILNLDLHISNIHVQEHIDLHLQIHFHLHLNLHQHVGVTVLLISHEKKNAVWKTFVP